MKKLREISTSFAARILISTMSIVTLVLIVSSLITYFLFSYHANRLIESQAREINKQILLNYEVYVESIMETANYIQAVSLPLDVANDYQALQELYLLNSGLKKDVVAIFLFDRFGKKVLGDDIDPGLWNLTDQVWFRAAMSDSSIFHFLSRGRMTHASHRNDPVISVSKQVAYRERGIRRVGILLIELNFHIIQNLADKTNLGERGLIQIIDEDDGLIYTSGYPLEESLIAATAAILGGRKVVIGNQDFFLNINTLAYTRWRMATFININHLNAVRSNMLPLLLLIFLTSIVLTILVTGIITIRILRPVHQLQQIMRRIEGGAIDTEISITGQREIVMLGESFNSMIIKIRELMDRIVTEQKEQRKTELRALQNQINPHFLYNSLDSIVWLAEHNRSEDVITAIVALARFFRISISRGATFIPIRNEIEHVKSYLTIQAIRYVDRFSYSFVIDPSLMEEKVMKLILQPLVENAINHGIGEANCSITICGERDKDKIFFQVINTGYGLSKGQIAQIHSHIEGKKREGEDVGVGLRNVNQRLKLYYGEGAGISLSSTPDEETIVTVQIPVKAEAEKR